MKGSITPTGNFFGHYLTLTEAGAGYGPGTNSLTHIMNWALTQKSHPGLIPRQLTLALCHNGED